MVTDGGSGCGLLVCVAGMRLRILDSPSHSPPTTVHTHRKVWYVSLE